MNNRNNKPILEEVVQADPSWFNEQGLMVNLEGPNFLSAIPFRNPSANRASGYYVADRSNDRLHEMTMRGLHSGEVPLKFSISEKRIHQELVDNKLAIIYSDGLVRVMNDKGVQIETWEPFRAVDRMDGLRTIFKKVWRRTAVTTTFRPRQDIDNMPLTYGEFFTALTEEMDATLRALGFSADMSIEYDDGKSDPWNWVFRLAQEHSDDAYNSIMALKYRGGKMWSKMPTEVNEFAFWRSVLTKLHSWSPTPGFATTALTSKNIPASVAPLIQWMRACIDEALKMRDAAWEKVRAEGGWDL